MMKNDYLAIFIERLNTYQIIRTHAFFSLYNEWFVEVIKALENEIFENLLLTTTDKLRYLKYVKKQVADKITYQNDTKFLDKWIKKYQLDESKFPFLENEEVQQLLDTNIKESILDYKKKKLCTNMQMDFYCHAAMVEKYKMIDFIDKLVELEIKNKQSNVPGDTIEVKVESKKEHEKSEVVEDIGSNDFTTSTIKDCLVDIIDDINNDDYKILVDALYLYFTTDKFPKLKHKIRFKSVNKKKVGWALKEIYKNLKMEKLSIEYFQFAKDNINLFEKEEIDNEDFKNSRFYKYFTTNPKK
jgi:hypothetical protein